MTKLQRTAIDDGWYPINTAPGDGRAVLLYDGQQVLPGYERQSIDGGWHWYEYGGDTELFPVKWCPFPLPHLGE